MKVSLILLLCFCLILMAVEARRKRGYRHHGRGQLMGGGRRRFMKMHRMRHSMRGMGHLGRLQNHMGGKSHVFAKFLSSVLSHKALSHNRHSISRSGLRSKFGAGCKVQCNQTCAPLQQCMINCNETCSTARSPFLCKKNCLVNECQPGNCTLCLKSCINEIDLCRGTQCDRQCPRLFSRRFIMSMRVCKRCMVANCRPVLEKVFGPKPAVDNATESNGNAVGEGHQESEEEGVEEEESEEEEEEEEGEEEEGEEGEEEAGEDGEEEEGEEEEEEEEEGEEESSIIWDLFEP